jgi:predicted ATPase
MSAKISVEQVLIDPVRSSVELPHSVMLYPLGFPLRLETNSENVIRAAREGWAEFPRSFDEPAIRLSLGVEGQGGALPPPPTFLSREHLMSIVSDTQNSVICDMQQGFAFGWVTESVAAARPFFRYHFLDAAVLTMILQLHLTPVHAGLVELKGHGILLCGDSCAGKSTLTYACARAGWTLICDDGTFLVRRRKDRYGIGNPFYLRFREDARFLFPELRSQLTETRPNGKIGIEVATHDLAGIVTATGSTIEHVVFLNRHGGGDARLVTLSRSEALERLQNATHFGLESVREEHWQAHRRLLTGGVWQLNYGDLGSAVERLETLASKGN